MSRPLAPHEIAARKGRRSFSPVLGAGILAALGCLTWIGTSALVTWIVWSFLQVHAAVLGEQHLFWVIGASAVFVLGLSMIWSAIRTLGGGVPVAAAEGSDTEASALDDLAFAVEDPSSVDHSDRAPSTANGQGNWGCSFLFGLGLVAVSGLILVVPILPQNQLLRLSFIGDMIASSRADRVSHYIDEDEYQSARRLGSLGLGTKTAVSALPKLSEELVLAEILLMSGADPDSRDVWGDTLLMEVSDPLFADRLLVHGASPDLRNDDGRTAGEEALARWDFGIATKFVDPTGDGAPLADAIRRGDHELLARLLSEGADPDSLVVLRAEHDYELSPLYYAATFGDLRAVNLLLEAGASQEAGLVPPLVGAVESRSTEIATRLVEAGATIDYYERPSTDALSRAIEFNAREMVQHLVSLGAGRSPEYFRILSYTDDPEIKEIVEAVIIDPNLE